MPAHHKVWVRLISATLVASLLLAPCAAANAQQPASAGAEVALIASDETSLTIALTIHDFAVEDVGGASGARQVVRIPGVYASALPGSPEVPVRGIWLGVPTLTGLAVKVLEVEHETLVGVKLPVGPQYVLETADLSGLAGAWLKPAPRPEQRPQTVDVLYPPAAVALGDSGYLRDQAVVQLLLYPVQTRPAASQVLLHRRIVARLSWPAFSSGAGMAGNRSSTAYEDLLRQTLLNYASLGRQLPMDASSAAPLEEAIGRPVDLASVLKIAVEHDGVYRVTHAQLAGAGLDPNTIDPRTIKVFNRGRQVPILVRGEEDGVFNQADDVLLYGIAEGGPYTIRNIYWLSAGGEPGLRMTVSDGAPAVGTPAPPHFLATLHAEADTVYWQAMPGSSGADRWFWGSRLSPSTAGMPSYRDYSLSLANISHTATQATVRVRLKGYTSLAHRTRIWLNGHLIDDQSWQGQAVFDHASTIPHSLLQNGANSVRVETVTTGAVVDQILVNWIELDYWDRYVAEGDELGFGTPATGRQQVAVDGLSTCDVLVLDTTQPYIPTRIANYATEPGGSTCRIRFDASAQADSRYFVAAATQHRPPAHIALDQPTSWRSPANAADYIVITHEDFYGSAQQLARHRHSQGLRTAVVKIGDIYDEFSAGVFAPQAVRDFLQYAYENWAAPAPTYVVLLGDSTQDYKDNLHDGTVVFVPSMNIATTLFGEVSSDNWFVSVAGADVLPDMLIGRLVAQSPAEADRMVQNLIRYDQNPPTSAWATRALLVADDDESVFSALAEDLADFLPDDYTATKVYAANYPPGNPRDDVMNHINDGAVIVTYVGHGEYHSWGICNNGQTRILDLPDVATLNNVDKLTFVVVGNCLNGFFAGPRDSPALAEAFQRGDRTGAIAVWAPTGLGYPSGHRILLKELYDAIFRRYQLSLGVSTTAAKLATYAQSSFWSELVETYVLFGDPATRLGIPAPHPFVSNVQLPLVIHE
ncbi:MAG TPA: C25 family cysteine peptidase [Anaerolineae bacterium]|nr:C25 family cysteine peptidase [Anaerolineae bacterium]